MATQKSSGGHLLVSLLLFVAAAGIAILLLIVSAVVWLSVVLDSVVWSASILGGAFAAIAAAVYFLLVRRSLAAMRERLETIYEVARKVQNAYEWVADKLRWIGALWNMFRERPE